jgi:hypothetical protein
MPNYEQFQVSVRLTFACVVAVSNRYGVHTSDLITQDNDNLWFVIRKNLALLDTLTLVV